MLLPKRSRVPVQRGDGPFTFPQGFLWGAATSDHQVEHAQDDDWTAFERLARAEKRQSRLAPGKVVPGHIHDIATVPSDWIDKKCDHDRLFDADFAAARRMGLTAYRLSLSWARLFPRADLTAPDPAALALYDRIFASLAAHGLAPFVTLFHFALPAWLAAPDAQGHRGVERADAVEHFARFARAIAKRYGAAVHSWCTLNEPMVYAYQGYVEGIFPPNERRRAPDGVVPVLEGLLRMHAAAYSALKAESVAPVGIAQHVRRFLPWRNHSLIDRLTAALIDRQFVLFFLDTLCRDAKRVPPFGPSLKVPKLDVDYVGVNYYGRFYVKSIGKRFEILPHDPAESEQDRSDLGWACDEDGLRLTLERFAKRYRLPLHVLECGIADGAVNDTRRQAFLVRHAHAIWRAVQAGADVRSFHYWSLLDNFEWAEGFEPRFGLLHVDYARDFTRTARPSAEVMHQLATGNAISPELWVQHRRR